MHLLRPRSSPFLLFLTHLVYCWLQACSSLTFPEILGPALANDVLLCGRKLTATEARNAGLVRTMRAAILLSQRALSPLNARWLRCLKHPSFTTT